MREYCTNTLWGNSIACDFFLEFRRFDSIAWLLETKTKFFSRLVNIWALFQEEKKRKKKNKLKSIHFKGRKVFINNKIPFARRFFTSVKNNKKVEEEKHTERENEPWEEEEKKQNAEVETDFPHSVVH